LDENARHEFLNSIDESEEKDKTTHYLLLICGTDENSNKLTHVMHIKDLEKFTKLHICPKCGYFRSWLL
jgi:ABC-type molybdenum transport system ATPase subunit/photorepair protein PhrA